MRKRIVVGIVFFILLLGLLAVATTVALRRQEIRPRAAETTSTPTSKPEARNTQTTRSSETFGNLLTGQPTTPVSGSPTTTIQTSPIAFVSQDQALSPQAPPTLDNVQPEALVNPPPWPILALLGAGATVLTVIGLVLLF